MKYIVSINGKNYEVEVKRSSQYNKNYRNSSGSSPSTGTPAPVPSVVVPILLFQQHLITLEVSPKTPSRYNPRN